MFLLCAPLVIPSIFTVYLTLYMYNIVVWRLRCGQRCGVRTPNNGPLCLNRLTPYAYTFCFVCCFVMFIVLISFSADIIFLLSLKRARTYPVISVSVCVSVVCSLGAVLSQYEQAVPVKAVSTDELDPLFLLVSLLRVTVCCLFVFVEYCCVFLCLRLSCCLCCHCCLVADGRFFLFILFLLFFYQPEDPTTQMFVEKSLAYMTVHQRQRISLLEGLCYVLQQIDTQTAPPTLAAAIEQVRLKADKWTKHEELLQISLRVLAVILNHSASEQYDVQSRLFVTRVMKLLSGDRTRRAALIALLTLLRGKYFNAEPGWMPDSASPTPPHGEQSQLGVPSTAASATHSTHWRQRLWRRRRRGGLWRTRKRANRRRLSAWP